MGVGLPNCLPFFETFHYIVFWVTHYTTLAMFSAHLRDGEQNVLWIHNLIYGAHNGRSVEITRLSPFLGNIPLH